MADAAIGRPSISVPERLRRVRDAFVGLLAANLAILIWTSIAAWATRNQAFAWQQEGVPWLVERVIRQSEGVLLFSGWGWLMIGLPFALLVPGEFIRRSSWAVRLLVGALIGPIAMFLIFAWLVGGKALTRDVFRNTVGIWILSSIMSTITYVVFTWLIDRRTCRTSPPAIGGEEHLSV